MYLSARLLPGYYDPVVLDKDTIFWRLDCGSGMLQHYQLINEKELAPLAELIEQVTGRVRASAKP
jgi:hypothetical protein